MFDIQINGLRNKLGSYETVKLFAVNLADATSFGRNNFAFDGLHNNIISVKVPDLIYNKLTRFEADGMQVVFIEKEYLNLLEAVKINYSQIF